MHIMMYITVQLSSIASVNFVRPGSSLSNSDKLPLGWLTVGTLSQF